MRTVSHIMAAIAVIAVALALGEAADPPVAGRGPELRFELADGTVITGRTDVKTITIRMPGGNVLKVPVADLTELSVGPAKPRSRVRAGGATLIGTVTVKEFRIAGPSGRITVKLSEVSRIRPAVRSVPGKLDHWSVELRDGTRLKGMAVRASLRIRTRYGTMVVPPARIQTAAFAAAGKTVRLQCRNSDRIIGALGPSATISLKTDKGAVDLSAAKIALLAARLTLDLELGKDVTMKFVLIPPGEFLMGSPTAEIDRSEDEGPQRKVTISKAFYIGVTEVTQLQYYRLTRRNPSKFKSLRSPVECVSWDDAMAFCAALSKKTRLTASLPTEAQWEYACRAGAKTRFGFGKADKDLAAHGWYKANSGAKTHPAGMKKPNAWGLYDMHGNVWEWCRDSYDVNFYASAKNVDPENTAVTNRRAVRGGSWGLTAGECRSADRHWGSATYRRYSGGGFRVVVSAHDAK